MSAPPPEQPMGPETTKFARIDPGPSHGFNFLASGLADVGFLVALVSILALDWFAGGGATLSFGDTHRVLENAGPVARGISSAYFSWLGWGLLVVTFAAALIALVPTVGRPFRVLAPLIAAVSVLLSFVAIDLFSGSSDTTSSAHRSYGDWLGDASTGFWLTVVGFVLMGVAGAIGPRRMAR